MQLTQAELLRIAQGFARKDSAAAADVSPETILGMAGAGETLSALFAASLRMVASRSATEREAAATPESAPARE